MEIELNRATVPFSLEHTLDCGQLFRWKKIDDWWYGVVADRVIKVKQNNENLTFNFFPETKNDGFIENYLRLDDDIPNILFRICKDEYMKKAVDLFSGLRLCRQEPWECLISYICATFKSIPAIKKMINNISTRLGKKLTFDGYDFYIFPKPNELAKVSLHDLRTCGLGFRAERVLETATLVDEGKLVIDDLKKIDYEEAKRKLLVLPGVGQKVADCILLFSLEKLEAFPIDVWMKRAITTIYAQHFDPSFIKKIANKGSITPKEYGIMSSFGREYFGNCAGYAQEYLFHYLRTRHQSRSLSFYDP